MQMPYYHGDVTEELEVHGMTVVNVVLGRTLLLPIQGFGHVAIQDKYFCLTVDPYIGCTVDIWNLLVDVNNISDSAEKDRKSVEAYEAMWQLILRISKSDFATENILEDLFRDHFYRCLREEQEFYRNQAASNKELREKELRERHEKFRG